MSVLTDYQLSANYWWGWADIDLTIGSILIATLALAALATVYARRRAKELRAKGFVRFYTTHGDVPLSIFPHYRHNSKYGPLQHALDDIENAPDLAAVTEANIRQWKGYKAEIAADGYAPGEAPRFEVYQVWVESPAARDATSFPEFAVLRASQYGGVPEVGYEQQLL
jgi:hypothetical protein